MPPCMGQPRRRRHRRHHHHHRMPTFGKHRGSVSGSPLHNSLARFATAHGLNHLRGPHDHHHHHLHHHTHALDKALSPAGLQPVAPGITAHLQRLYEDLLRGDGDGAAQAQGEKGGGLGRLGGRGAEKRTPCGGVEEPLLSRAAAEQFVRDVQRDTSAMRWPFAKADGLTFQEFVHFWWEEYSAAKRPIDPDDKDLDKPISNYFISSSHNTYIEDGDQFFGEAKALQYKKVLESGCRCVEIDVWNGTDADEDNNEAATAPGRARSAGASHHKIEKKKGQHWSFGSMLSWMQATCDETRRSMTFPKSLKSKKSEASFKARPPRRARPILDMVEDSASTVASLLAREPRVCHAYESRAGDVSLHEAIPFRTVCRTIREAAFSRGNDLPVIISLEVHANGPQQEKMVHIMREEWGGLLLDEPLPGYDPRTTQPTLRDLRNKILLKIKTGSQQPPAAAAATTATSTPGAPSPPHVDSRSTLQVGSSSQPYSDCGASALSVGDGATAPHRSSSRISSHNKKPTTIEALARLAVYTYSPGSFTSFARVDSTAPAHIYSFGEERLKALHRTEHEAVFRHNRAYLARTFPESLRSFLSSNPNCPTLFWRKGVQMVALNWQVWDTAMEINDAMFDRERGWVLKPPGYRGGGGGGGGNDGGGDNDDDDSAADCQADVAGKKRMDLTITVLAGQQIPTNDDEETTRGSSTRLSLFGPTAVDLRPRVTCFLHVESAAERDPRKNISKDEVARRTKVARTEQPDWGAGGSRLSFSGVRHVVEELSFVRFHVDHCRRGWPDRTAWACIRLDRLQEGYRLIKLKTDDGYTSDGLLLVKIQKTLVDEPPRVRSLRSRTWNVCKDGASQLKTQWSCMG